jgi:hypothetical protein
VTLKVRRIGAVDYTGVVGALLLVVVSILWLVGKFDLLLDHLEVFGAYLIVLADVLEIFFPTLKLNSQIVCRLFLKALTSSQ